MKQQTTIEEDNVTVADFSEIKESVAFLTGLAALEAGLIVRRLQREASPGWLSVAAAQLRAIERLPQGWDSRGGAPPDAETVKSARRLLEHIAHAIPGISKPHARPTPSGGVQFDWTSGTRYFEIELVDRGTAQYFFEDSGTRQEYEDTLQLGQSMNRMLDYLRLVGYGK